MLLETHISGERAKRVARKLQFDDHFLVEADGYAGEIWIFWDYSIGHVTISS